MVTGASAGVGRATAVALAAAGFDVALLARGEAGLAAAAAEVAVGRRRALPIAVDVASWEEVDAAAARVEHELGPLDLWVNDAMTTVFSPFRDTDPADFRRATEVTYVGQVHGTMAALQRMLPRDRGRVVNVGSSLSYVGIPLQAAYCGAKFACRGFTESVRAELLADGSQVTISMVHLPAVDTPQFGWCRSTLPKHPRPVPPVYPPEVAARRIVATALDGRRSTVLGAWNRLIVAGAKVAPDVLAHYVGRTGVSAQQTDRLPVGERSDNLYEPADAEADAGASGSFGDQAGGSLEPSFLATLPRTLAQLGAAVGAVAGSKMARARRAASARHRR